MASLIPAIGTCLARMTGGEKRLARRLEDKLEDDYLVWYDTTPSSFFKKQSEADPFSSAYVRTAVAL